MSEKMNLELALAAYSDAIESGARPKLAEFLKQYPEFREDITRFAVYRDVVDALEPLAVSDERAESRFSERASRAAERLRSEAAAGEPVRLNSLVKAAARQGINPTVLAEKIGLSVSFVARLDQRLFRPSSVPRPLMERLAEVIQATLADVAQYLALPPRTALAADYRSHGAPEVREQIDFQQAVVDALDLSQEQKDAWVRRTSGESGTP